MWTGELLMEWLLKLFPGYKRLLKAYEVQKKKTAQLDEIIEEFEWLKESHKELTYSRVLANRALMMERMNQSNKRKKAAKYIQDLQYALIERNDRIEELNKLLAELEQESRSDNCKKILCCNMEEANALALVVSNSRGGEIFEAYQCPVCPINKRTNRRFWHIRHKDPKKRGKYYG